MLDDQLLAIALTAILASGHFPCPMDDWEALACINKTWAAWKTHCCAAHIAHKRQMLAAGMTTGVANVVMTGEDATISDATFAKLNGYLDKLAVAATMEKTILAQLIENNAMLTSNITTLTASVASLTSAYTILAAGKNNTAAPSGNNKQQPCHNDRKPLYLAMGGYCWMHGYHVRKGHDSAAARTKRGTQRQGGAHKHYEWHTVNKGWETT
jgi:hypothetical protein